jgi:uncharacterized spore protein YtfJ
MDEKMVLSTEPIEDMLKRLNVGSVFGEPIKEGDATIIPVASVGYCFGYGYGHGSGTAVSTETDKPPSTGEGAGGGGGGGGTARPQGVIRISADGVRCEPLVNATAISLAGIGMVAWSVFWIAAAVRAFAKSR